MLVLLGKDETEDTHVVELVDGFLILTVVFLPGFLEIELMLLLRVDLQKHKVDHVERYSIYQESSQSAENMVIWVQLYSLDYTLVKGVVNIHFIWFKPHLV